MKPSAALLLASLVFALPITCSTGGGDGLYSGGFEPSPGGIVNPAEPGFASGQGSSDR